ncbi:MetQ/NlpA family ABC transporter substrate-binding protein [Tenuibacillus multivorans]|uniref:Lipoprotein n=1 Tax=Tenuibacillus multivorans TaxID=237069 RepID=A0A1G9WHM3_9BACI|nr:MetQ/NlpA family ABC transporter substrate-binding protein [Tenuibacillus multivorans]GEL76454.1 lipoprotein [Tenuibacillus multivorans]SDM83565.1 D-methionine transport system substrate-binding protein [Tenuibacillus multivorans]
MKKLLNISLALLVLSIILAGCGSSGSSDETVKVGLNGSGVPVWEKMKELAAEEGIEIELVEFADYVRPNLALADGDIDLNAFQTVSYFDSFIEEHDLDLAPIASTYIAPMGIYSDKYESVDEIPEGRKVALPKEATNMGRALLLLEKAGLITLPEDFDGNGAIDKIVENPKGLKFEPIVAAQTPRVLPDVAISVINNGVAIEAGFLPVEDAIFIEDDTATPYINIIAARADETDHETYQKIAEIYQQEVVADHIREVYNNSLIPTFVPLEDIGW